VLGATDYTITLTPEAEAHGFAEAFGREFTCSIGGYGRGERASTHANDVVGTVRLARPCPGSVIAGRHPAE
jgi:hypothetical protein